MEPRIQYAKTEDGVDIAFTTYGDGPPLVIPPNIMNSHLQLELTVTSISSFLQRLASRLTIVRFDPRGVGMSQRDAVDFSAEAAERDLMAVVDRAGLQTFALYQHILAGQGPMAFAVHYPERVRGMVLWAGQTVATGVPEILPRFEAIEHLRERDWEMYTQIVARLIWGWDSPNATPQAEMTRAASSPSTYRESMRAAMGARGASWPGDIHVPALVLHVTGAEDPTNIARNWASAMPAAHVVAVPGSPTVLNPFVYDSEILTTAIADFVESLFTEGAKPLAPELKLSAMRAILWTDLEGHTPIMQRLGDERGRELLREHERITRDALAAHGGTEVKTMGDAFMAWFPSAQQALSCAVALQRAFAERNATAAEPLHVRVGVNAGEPVEEEDDLFGNSVIAAARICHEATGGEIVVSDVVRQLVAGKGFSFIERGEVALKGFDEALRLFEVRWRD